MNSENEHSYIPRVLKAYMDKVAGPSLVELGLTVSTSPFLAEIYYNEGISLKGLTDLLMVDKAHTTRVISKLIESGFVENKAQGHEYSIYLTDEGREMALRANEILREAWMGLFRDLTDEERETLKVIYDKVANVVREEIR